MANKSSSIRRMRLSNFKLNSLLNITQAINENLSVDDLLSRYQEILCDELNIGKVLVYSYSDSWKCILKSGLPSEFNLDIRVEQDLLPFEEITFVTTLEDSRLHIFDILIPVYHKNSPIAYVLIGDIDEEAEGVSPTIKHLNFIQTLSNIIVVAIENIRLFNESLRQEAIRKELELASRMQSMLIPNRHDLPRDDNVHITAFYHPHFDVGGDYYDVIRLDKGEIGFCIADVSGKGISAALLMSNFQANLRALFSHEISLSALVEKLNNRVMASANGEKFITLFIAKYNYKTQELEYINAAHNPPILYKTKDKKISKLENGCVGMGMLDDIPIIKKGLITIDQPTKLLCYTDGLVEMLNDENEKVETETTFIEEALSNTKAIEQNIETIINGQNILENNAAIFDDISMLGLEFFL